MDNNEEIFTDISADDEAETGDAAIKRLRERLARAVEEKQEYLNLSQRLKADYVNLQKAVDRQRDDIARTTKMAITLDLLTLADSFAQALKNPTAGVAENWLSGVTNLEAQLKAILHQHGIDSFTPAARENFDPSRHESVGLVDTTAADEDNLIADVVQAGYLMDGKVLRAAKVRVFILKDDK